MAPPKLYTRRSTATSQSSVRVNQNASANQSTNANANRDKRLTEETHKRPSEESQLADNGVAHMKKKRRIEVEVVNDGARAPVPQGHRRSDDLQAKDSSTKPALPAAKPTRALEESRAVEKPHTNGISKHAPPAPAPRVRRTQTSPPKAVQTSVTQLKDGPSKASRSATPSPTKVDARMNVDNPPTSPKRSPSKAPTARPKTLARDLSSLFSACLPSTSQLPSASPSPTRKLSKRMLGRSKTESSISSTTHASIFDSPSSSSKALSAADSLPNISASPAPSPSRRQTIQDTSSPPSSPSRSGHGDHAHPPPHPGKTIRTYAGASRSFLMAIPLAAANDPSQNPAGVPLDLSSLAEPPPEEAPESVPYATLHAMYLPSSDDDNMMNPLLKSITDLRSRGEARRWADEAGYLLEGLEAGAAMGLRRASALDIAKKLAVDDEFWEKARRADDFFGTVWARFVAAGAGTARVEDADALLDSLLVSFVALVSRDGQALADLAGYAGFCEALFRVMARSQKFDVLSDGPTPATVRLSKKEKAFAVSVKDILGPHLAKICSPDANSTSSLIVHILSRLVPSCLPPSRVDDVVDSIRSCLSTSRPESFAMRHTYRLSNALSLLDSFLLGQWNSSEPSAPDVLDGEDWLAPALLGLLQITPPKGKGKAREDAIPDTTTALPNLALRILTTLSHGSKPWCRRVERAGGVRKLGALLRACADSSATDRTAWASRQARHAIKMENMHSVKAEADDEVVPSAVKDPDDEGLQDTLYITLALLTNLAQELGACDGMDDDVIDTLLRLHAASSSACLDSISDPLEAPETVAAREAERIYVPGHLAILLGMLMRDSESVRDAVLRRRQPATRESLKTESSGLKVEDGVDIRGGGAAYGVDRLADDAKAFVRIWGFTIGAAQDGRSAADGEVAGEVLAYYETLSSGDFR